MLTVDDLHNPARKTGFNYVKKSSTVKSRPFQAQKFGGPSTDGKRGSGLLWCGPYRLTAEEAAQDYCEYINGLVEQPQAAPTLNTPGHVRRKSVVNERDPEEEAAWGVIRDRNAQRAGRQGYVYCIGVTSDPYAVKVGYSVNPEARVGELQTGNPRILVLLGKKEGTLEDERALHAKYIRDNTVGEWFKTSPALLGEFGLDSNIIGVKSPELYTHEEYIAGQTHSRSLSEAFDY